MTICHGIVHLPIECSVAQGLVVFCMHFSLRQLHLGHVDKATQTHIILQPSIRGNSCLYEKETELAVLMPFPKYPTVPQSIALATQGISLLNVPALHCNSSNSRPKKCQAAQSPPEKCDADHGWADFRGRGGSREPTGWTCPTKTGSHDGTPKPTQEHPKFQWSGETKGGGWGSQGAEWGKGGGVGGAGDWKGRRALPYEVRTRRSHPCQD